ncbi:MAG: HAD-IC family P-type ATPase, partial [Spirochaetota bacterium]
RSVRVGAAGRCAAGRGVALSNATGFRSRHGVGVSATVSGRLVEVGKPTSDPRAEARPAPSDEAEAATVLEVRVDGEIAGSLLITDTPREGVAEAIEAVRALGIERVELLTGDNEAVARALAREIGVDYRANLLPEQKIQIVRDYQETGHTVVMIGDGVNDAPALVQANVGIAMGAMGSDVAIEAAHVCLLREDWALVPALLRMAHRTMRVVYTNIGLTTLYNLAGLTLAALGILPPVLAAAAQSVPDIGIVANSSRLLKQKL